MKKLLTNNVLGITYTFIGASLWGLSGVLGEYLLNISKINSSWVITNRIFFSGLIMIFYLYLKNKSKIFLIYKNKRDVFSLLKFSFLGLLVCQATYFLSVKYTNAPTATILQYIGPTIIMCYYCIFKKRFPSFNEIIAILFSFLGTIIIATHCDIKNIQVSLIGIFWGIFSAFGLALYSVLSLGLIKKYGAILVVAWGFFIAGIVSEFATFNFYLPKNFTLLDFFAFLGVVIFGTILSFSFYLEGVQKIGAIKGSIIACFEPIAAIIFSYLLLEANLTVYDFIGVLFILASVFILNIRASRRKNDL